MFFYLSKLLFSSFLQFKAYFAHGQNTRTELLLAQRQSRGHYLQSLETDTWLDIQDTCT